MDEVDAKPGTGSAAITRLLAARHHRDVFVAECKTGPSIGAPCPRLDAWAMVRSWVRPCCVGYEIKTERSDFLRDDKWPLYLPFCNRFAFVCPPGVIQRDECPEDAGLIYAAANGRRLLTKKKAPHRAGDVPDTLYRYVLMSRALIEDEHPPRDEADYWRAWLDEKREKATLGWQVSRRIRELVAERITAVDRENRRLKETLDGLEGFREAMRACDLDPDRPPDAWAREQKIRELNERIPADLRGLIHRTRIALEALDETVARKTE